LYKYDINAQKIIYFAVIKSMIVDQKTEKEDCNKKREREREREGNCPF
jgi:hypothetical protein